uniref:Uncharacterized protein n=1 Tax=Avena sativa TaxID=4498 RepID=A0ACD5TTE2_AVESA
MLLQILVRLRCARAAARTGLLSRRWLGLWARLPGLTFRGVPAGKIESALARAALPTAVSLIDIRLSESISWDSCKLDDAHAKSLLRAAARLSPEELVFILPDCRMVKPGRPVTIVLPCFRRATSIELDTCFLPIKLPPAGELPALEMLSISGNIVDLGAFLNRCPRLRVLRVTFRGVKPGSLELAIAALQAAAALGLVLSRLGIEFDYVDGRQNIDGACFASLLGAVATLSPLELFFENGFREWTDADMLCFPHTTSIEMNLYRLRFTKLPDGEFSALERLSLSGCTLVNIVTMVSRCPRLRVLKVIADKFARDVTIHSASLQELQICVTERSWCRRIDIRTPLLKQLNLNVHGNTALTVSIMAPLLEKVSWRWEYAELPLMFGFWSLRMVKLVTAESNNGKDGVLNNDAQDACLPHPRINVLSLDVNASYHLGAAMNFVAEIEKIPVTNFSVLELHISQRGHVYGAFLLRLFGMHHIRTAI